MINFYIIYFFDKVFIRFLLSSGLVSNLLCFGDLIVNFLKYINVICKQIKRNLRTNEMTIQRYYYKIDLVNPKKKIQKKKVQEASLCVKKNKQMEKREHKQ